MGVLFIVHPVASAVVIPWVMGIFVVAYGIFEIVAAVRFHSVLPGWGWVLFAGIVSLFCGIAFFLWPGTFALFLGFFLMARGVQMAVYGVSLPQATILSDAIDTTSFKVLHEQNNFLNPIGVEDVTQYIDESRQQAEAAAISGEVLNEAQENAVSSIEALLGAALPEGYTIEVSSAVQG